MIWDAKQGEKESDRTVEVIRNRLFFSVAKVSPYTKIRTTKSTTYLCVDDELKYRNFFNDFGPLSISCLFKYWLKMTKCWKSLNGRKRIVHYTGHQLSKKTNAAFLMGAHAVLYHKMTPAEVYGLLEPLEPFKPFVDAIQTTSIHTIRLFDCWQAIAKALAFNFFNFDDFNVTEYDVSDKLQFGNMNWIVPRKFVGFIGPSDARFGMGHRPDFYVEFFLQNDIKTVIRLNNKLYDSSVFTQVGIEHYDLFFEDGTPPTREILLKFLRIAETAPAAIAVHCKAGLGRTGTLIAAYLIKHYQMTAREAIAWIRICRPGSVIGTQQIWLEEMESWLWHIGAEYRLRHYGNSNRLPQHKYGIYSKQWPIDRRKYIDARKQQLPPIPPVNCVPKKDSSEKRYFRQISRLLSSVRSFDEKTPKPRVLTVVPHRNF